MKETMSPLRSFNLLTKKEFYNFSESFAKSQGMKHVLAAVLL